MWGEKQLAEVGFANLSPLIFRQTHVKKCEQSWLMTSNADIDSLMRSHVLIRHGLKPFRMRATALTIFYTNGVRKAVSRQIQSSHAAMATKSQRGIQQPLKKTLLQD